MYYELLSLLKCVALLHWGYKIFVIEVLHRRWCPTERKAEICLPQRQHSWQYEEFLSFSVQSRL